MFQYDYKNSHENVIVVKKTSVACISFRFNSLATPNRTPTLAPANFLIKSYDFSKQRVACFW